MQINRTPLFHYRLGLNQPIGSPTQRRLSEMAGAIARENDGALHLEVFPESRLGPDPKMLADMRGGTLEFFVAGATLGELAPTSALPLLPFAFADSTAVFKALDGALGERIPRRRTPNMASRARANAAIRKARDATTES